MTPIEFDIIDELYFVTSYADLTKSLAVEDTEFQASLVHLIKQGYVKCFFPDPDTEIEFDETSALENLTNYYFLATKAGLIAHNSR